MRNSLILLLLVPVVASCGGPPRACEADPSELRMRAFIVDDGFGSFVDISFSDEDDDDLDDSMRLCLEEGSDLTVNGMVPREDSSAGWRYIAEFAVPPNEYEIVYTSGDTNETFTARVTPAAHFEFDAPEPGDELSRAEDALVQWSNFGPGQADGLARLFVTNEDVTCLERDYEAIVDDDLAEFTVPAGAIEPGADAMANCDAAFVLGKLVFGEYPAGLHPGGYVDALTLRGLRFVSTP